MPSQTEAQTAHMALYEEIVSCIRADQAAETDYVTSCSNLEAWVAMGTPAVGELERLGAYHLRCQALAATAFARLAYMVSEFEVHAAEVAYQPGSDTADAIEDIVGDSE